MSIEGDMTTEELATEIIKQCDKATGYLLGAGRSYVGVDELSNYLLDIRLVCSSILEPAGGDNEDEQLQDELDSLLGADTSVG